MLRAGKRSFSVATDEDIEKYCDQELVTWLQSNAFSNDAIKKVSIFLPPNIWVVSIRILNGVAGHGRCRPVGRSVA